MTIAILTLIGTTPILLQEEESFARGQEYLERLGADLESRVPLEQTCGVFMGRKWVGELRMIVRKAPENSGAVLEWSIDGKMHVMDHDLRFQAKALFQKGLALHSAEYVSEESGRPERKNLSVSEGKWTVRTEKEGKVEETTGEIKPASTVHPELLLILSLCPQDELRMRDLLSEPSERRFAPVSEKASLVVGGRSVECRGIRIHQGKKKSDLLYFDEKARAVELRASHLPVRIRPVPASETGQDLKEPLQLSDSERALIELFRAIKRQDREKALSTFDFERLAQEMVPGFGSLKEEDQKRMVESLRQNIGANLLKEETSKSLPEEELLEDILSELFEGSEKGDLAEIRFEKQVWHLYRATEGDRKGRWFIYKIVQQ